jgi:LacI family repressor for deo operon, udp, cdd, tsx, nupC, and nupG
MPTIKDVAKLAGVSTATVSRAMVTPERVSAKNRKKVELAVAECGFTPNAIARNLRTRESKIVVVILPDIANMFFADIVRGIQLVAEKQGFKVLLGDSVHTVKQAEDYINLVRTKQADGIISLTAELPPSIKDDSSIPMVMACEYFTGFPIPTVRVDNAGSAKRAIEYLLELGHTHIGCITGPMENPICEDRKQGFIDAKLGAGEGVDNLCFESGDFSFHSGYSAFQRLHNQYEMTALFCFNDMMALGAMRAAIEMGIDVPKELSIVGFDDLLFAEYTTPQLTTVRQPQKQIGETAMMVLAKLLRGDTVPQDNVIPTQLLVRSSSTANRRG